MEGARYSTWSARANVAAKAPARLEPPKRLAVIAAASTLACIALLSLAFGFGARAIFGGLGLGALFTVRVSLLGWVSEWFGRRRKGSAAAYAIYKSLGIEGAHAVRIEVILDLYQIGKDEGIVVFRDGQMQFYGQRTSFRMNSGHDLLLGGFVLPEKMGMKHVVRVFPFERLNPDDDTFREHYFWRDYKTWQDTPHPNVEEILPPATPHKASEVVIARTQPIWIDVLFGIGLWSHLLRLYGRGIEPIVFAAILLFILLSWAYSRWKVNHFIRSQG